MPEGTSRGESSTSRGRGRGRGRRRGRGGGGSQDRPAQTGPPANPAAQAVAAAAARARANSVHEEVADDDDDDADVCFICANPVAHHSIAPCNHTTCHICGLRMRALYKTKDCAHCRTPAPFVIFSDDGDKRFEDYTPADITTTDSNIGIKYTNEDIVGDTVLLLRYNCPAPDCDFAGLGWPDLHRHVKTTHRKRMCDLCTRNKRVFTHEHELFSDRELERHMRHGDDKPGAADQTGFKGHPLCGFCGERFYDDDKLYEHCRMKHERCFLCDRRDSRTPHYYLDYNALEEHFRKDHFLCANSECMEKKFVVFESQMDLQAHMLAEHAGAKTVGRDARTVDMSSFEVRQAYQQPRRRGRGRDPNAEAPVTSAQALRRDEVALQRQMAIHSAQSVSNRTFGGQLSSPARSGASTPTRTAATGAAGAAAGSLVDPMEALTVDASSLPPEERARLVRHSAVVERAANLLGNDTSKVALFRQHISSYRQGGLTAPQLIDAFFTLFADVSSNALGTLVREVADLFDDKTKADNLRTAWQDWRAINEDYPSLPGLSGMQGATSSSSGWANAATANPGRPNAAPAQQHSNRVLRLKNSTRLGGPAPVAANMPGWVPQSANAASFPSLGSTTSSVAPRPRAPRAQPAAEDAFPSLPAAPKPTTTIFGYGSGRGVRRDYGHAESSFQWGAAAAPEPKAEEEDKGRKKKGKKVLLQWG